MTTARDLLTAAVSEAPTVWADVIAATPSGAELLRRADEAERLREALGKSANAGLDALSAALKSRATDPWKEVAAEVLQWKADMLLRYDLAEDSTPRDVRVAMLQEVRLRLHDAGVHDAACPEPGQPCTCGIDANLMDPDAWTVPAWPALATPATDDAEPDPTALLR